MAVVADLSGNSGPAPGNVDRKYSSVNRTVAVVHGTATPQYVGELVTDIAADCNYRGTGTAANTDWAMEPTRK